MNASAMTAIAREMAPRSDSGYIIDLLVEARGRGASDLHITAGEVPWMRIDGSMHALATRPIVDPAAVQAFVGTDVFSDSQRARLFGPNGHTESRYEDVDTGPIRIQAYRTFQGTAIALRLLSDTVPKLASLGLPKIVETFANIRNGLVLFTGETGSGKSTALAAVIDRILDSDQLNVITFEDPIEYRHRCLTPDGLPRRSRLTQVAIGMHADSYQECLRSALRSDPDVIMVGEMRDATTIRSTIETAETGHTVFSTGHDQRATKTVSRLVNSFPPEQQNAICYSLAHVLRAIISLRLLPHRSGKGRVSCSEVLIINDSVKSLIENQKINELTNALSQGSGAGMQTLEQDLARLVADGKISADVAKGEVEVERHDQLKQMFERYKVKF
jgi:twitching motility protein PilT